MIEEIEEVVVGDILTPEGRFERWKRWWKNVV